MLVRCQMQTSPESSHPASSTFIREAQKRTATIKAVTNCDLYEFSKDDFLQLAEDKYDLGFRILLNMARIVSTRLRKADEETVKLTTALSIILKEL